MSTTLFRHEIQRTFSRVADEAIEQGLLTHEERVTIGRRHTRKHGNWIRHLRDLCAYIEYKQEKTGCQHSSKN